jgi:type IV pilus assembly protein PilC
MSGPTGDSTAPRRPKKPDAAKAAQSTPPTDPAEPTTFRPNPRKVGTKARATGTLPGDVDPGRGPSTFERIFFGSVSSGQLATFCRQFAAYLNAGVDISKALVSLQKQFAMTALGPVIGRLAKAVKQGDAFAEAVAREPRAFDALFVGMIKVAEARGGLPETLRNLSRHYENRQSLIRQARSAMIYPIAVLFVAACVVALMTIWLLPMFADLLRDVAGRGADLPLPSRILMGFSDFVKTAGWLLIPAVLIGTPIALIQLYRTQTAKPVMDRILMMIPVFGKLMKKIDTTRFARTLGALLEAGVDVGSSLDLTSEVLRLDPFRRAIVDTKSRVLNGEELSVALDETGRFGPDVIAVINSGEETGKLPESLNHLADDYEEQVAYMVKNMGQLVQPILLVLLGGVVLFIILAVFLPYISILTNLAGGGH